MEYKGYISKVELDEESGLLHSAVINTHDVITFEGESLDEAIQALRDSIDDYLALCAERGEEPDKMVFRPIRTEADYEQVLREIEGLMDAQPGTDEADRLDALATLVEAYEARHYPIIPPDQPL